MSDKEIHRARFERVTEHGSEFFRVTCLDTGATAMHWPSYLKDGHALTVWSNDGSEACGYIEHVNVSKKAKE